jgi:4-amino-4-deoxy-L-arabinose transferase-like glycosyltransferase
MNFRDPGKSDFTAAESFENRVSSIAVFLFWLSLAIVNIWWLKADTRPPYYDTAGHATTTLQLVKLTLHGNPQSVLEGILSVGPYPPFAHLVALPFVLLFEPTIDALLAANLVFLGIVLGCVYGLGRLFGRPFTGVLAAFLVGMYPVIYGLSRHYLLDIPLTAMVTLSIFCLLRAGNFKRLAPSVLLGVSLGLGMLTKWTFAVFLAGPLLIATLYTVKRFPFTHTRNLLIACLIGGVIAGPWYIRNLANLVSFLPVSGDIAAALEGDPAGTLEAWLYYGRQLVDQQMLTPFVALFVGGLVLLLRRRRLDEPIFVIFAWLLVPYLVFSYYANKDLRYTLPYLPAIALITAIGLSEISNRKVVRVGIVFVALYALVLFGGLSFGLSQRLPAGVLPSRVSVELGGFPLTLYSEYVHIASPPSAEDWKVQDILRDVMNDAIGSKQISTPVTLVVIPNRPFFEPQGFRYFVQAGDLPVEVTFITGVVEIDSVARLAASDYVVTKTGDQGPTWLLQEAAAVTDRLQKEGDSGLQFAQIGEYALPDGSVARLYRHRRDTP